FNISVIIPVYNAEKFIERAVLSALNQSETEEVILIEDGSKDSSLNLCRVLEARFEKVKLFNHPRGSNKGAGASRNMGLKKATSNFIAFLDADDYFLPNRFKDTKTVFDKFHDTDGVYECIGTDFSSNKAKYDYRKTKRKLLTTINTPDISPRNLFKALVLNQHGYFSLDGLTIKKSSLDHSLLFDEKLRIAQDTDFILTIAEQKNLRAGNISSPVTMRVIHGENRTMVSTNVLLYKEQFYKKWFLVT